MMITKASALEALKKEIDRAVEAPAESRVERFEYVAKLSGARAEVESVETIEEGSLSEETGEILMMLSEK